MMIHHMGTRDQLTENKHHNVPGSRGGSGREINLSVILEQRHDRFHSWSWNRTPEILMRKILIRGIGLEGRYALPPSALEDTLMEMCVPDWTDLYDADAVLWKHGAGHRNQVHKAHNHAVEHLIDELQDTRHTVNALLHGRSFPMEEMDEEQEFLRRALRFFRTDVPGEAVRQFLIEEYKHALLWVKPLKDDIRKRLLRILSSAQPVTLDRKDKNTVVEILKDHEMHLLSSLLHERSR